MKKKRVYNKSTGRNYDYDKKYQSSKEQVKNRVARNKARREMKKELEESYGKKKAASIMKDKDVDHKRPLSKGGSNAKSNRRLISKSKNRGRK